jgi:hypothetical protein
MYQYKAKIARVPITTRMDPAQKLDISLLVHGAFRR